VSVSGFKPETFTPERSRQNGFTAATRDARDTRVLQRNPVNT